MDKRDDTASLTESPADSDSEQVSNPERPRHIALFFGRFGYGGPPQVWLRVGAALARAGHNIDCLTIEPPPDDYPPIPAEIRQIVLRPQSRARALYYACRSTFRPLGPLFRHRPRWLKAVPPLAEYLQEHRPDALFAAQHHWNMAALLAHAHTRVPTRIIVSLHMHIGQHTQNHPKRRSRLAYQFAHYYPTAHALMVPSRGVAEDAAQLSGISIDNITVSPNPAFAPGDDNFRQAPAPHPWLEQKDRPVILGAGRIAPAKGFDILLKAFAKIRKQRPARLIIIGRPTESYSGELNNLQLLAEHLGIAEDVSFPGYTTNPFAFMARSDLFILSSNREGFANVVVEALACGCPVVSTDCPAGPAEILDCGRYGILVPVGDSDAIADAAIRTLDSPPSQEQLLERAADFTPDAIARHWVRLLKH